MARDAAARDDEGHGGDNQQDAARQAEGERLAKEGHADEDRRQGFQRPEDGGRRGADVLDGHGRAEERDRGGEERQREQVRPQVPVFGNHQRLPEVDAYEEEREAEQQHVEGQLHGGDLLQARTVHAYDVQGVGERRAHDQQDAHRAQHLAAVAFVQQGDARQRQEDAGDGEFRYLLLEEEGHDERHHDGIDEQQGRGDTRRHVSVAKEQGERGEGEHKPHDDEREDAFPGKPEIPSTRLDHDRHDGDGE